MGIRSIVITNRLLYSFILYFILVYIIYNYIHVHVGQRLLFFYRRIVYFNKKSTKYITYKHTHM